MVLLKDTLCMGLQLVPLRSAGECDLPSSYLTSRLIASLI